MTRNPEQLVDDLSAIDSDATTRLKALRSIKNSVIGNKRQKLNFIKLGAVQLLVDVLATETDPSILVQAAATLGSLAATPDGLGAVVDEGAIPHLLKALTNNDQQVVEAAVRSLKMIYKPPSPAPPSQIFTSTALPTLVALLASPTANLADCAATILSTCETLDQQNAAAAAGALPQLTQLLEQESAQKNRQDAALEALAALTAGNAQVSSQLIRQQTVVDHLMDAAKLANSPKTRFAACVCLANICRVLPSTDPSTYAQKSLLQHSILPVLVQLLTEENVGPEVASVLSLLVADNAELQRAAADADAIPRLARFIKGLEKTNSSSPNGTSQAGGINNSNTDGDHKVLDTKCKEGVLRALALLCCEHEEHRRQLVTSGALPAVAAALSDESHGVRAAACSCMRSLSRSTRLLRGNLGSIDVAGPLLDLSGDDDLTVASQATAALANMAVEYSAVKDQLLKKDGIARFVQLTSSMHVPLRLHGVWGLSSVAYMSTADVKKAIIAKLPWRSALELLQDPDAAVREKTMLLLRNLVYSGSPDAAHVMQWSGGTLLTEIKTALEKEENAAAAQLRLHALYVVVNLSSGGPEHKTAVMEAGWPSLLAAQLDNPDERVREAAVWAIINLTWRRDDNAASDRCAALRALGIVSRLHRLAQDASLQVRERASTALEQLEGGDALPSDVDMFPDEDDDDDDNEDDDEGGPPGGGFIDIEFHEEYDEDEEIDEDDEEEDIEIDEGDIIVDEDEFIEAGDLGEQPEYNRGGELIVPISIMRRISRDDDSDDSDQGMPSGGGAPSEAAYNNPAPSNTRRTVPAGQRGGLVVQRWRRATRSEAGAPFNPPRPAGRDASPSPGAAGPSPRRRQRGDDDDEHQGGSRRRGEGGASGSGAA